MGDPTALPTVPRSSGLSASSSARESNFPAAHCPRRKYWVSVRVRNLSIRTSLTEFVPELRGIMGTPDAVASVFCCPCGSTSFAPGLRQ